jgi:hypothetical protein
MLFVLCASPWASGSVPSIVRSSTVLAMLVMREPSPLFFDVRTSL